MAPTRRFNASPEKDLPAFIGRDLKRPPVIENQCGSQRGAVPSSPPPTPFSQAWLAEVTAAGGMHGAAPLSSGA